MLFLFPIDSQAEAVSYQPQTLRQNASSPGKLHTLVEEDEAQVKAYFTFSVRRKCTEICLYMLTKKICLCVAI